jgi:putative DNA primase/helicase
MELQSSQVACVTTGRKWPDGSDGIPPGRVIMLTAEDNLSQTVKPRLLAAGADCNRVFFLPRIRKDNKNRMFLLAQDFDELEEYLRNGGPVRI